MTNIDVNTMLQPLLYGGLIIALLISSVTDLRQRRIPNLVTGPTIVLALITYCFINGLEGFLFSLGGLAFGLAVFALPYLMGGMGAGDVKLMGAVGAVLGFGQTFVALLFIAIVGGVMALGMMLYRGTLKQTLLKIFVSFLFLGAHKDASLLKVDKNEQTQAGIPYALAITSGVCLFFIYLLINKEALPVVALL
ncbi:MAG: A24 family peptidase [Desulfoarculaceae bacterium]|nr:A24 family peptidase [Desulfoarculaceae bacterium]